MALNELTFNEKMDKLNSSQQSIENTSTWCGLWRNDARAVANHWENYFSKTTQAKRLAMIYLANDVLQNSRKKGPEFIMEFFKVMPRALRHFITKADDKSKASALKVIRVWEQRRVFGSSGAKAMRQLIEEAEGHPPASTVPSAVARYSPSMPQSVSAPSGSGAETAVAAGEVPEALTAAARAVSEAERAAARVGAAAPSLGTAGPQQVVQLREQLENIRVAMVKREAARAALQAAADAQEAAWRAAATQLQACSAGLEAAAEAASTANGAAAAAEKNYFQAYTPAVPAEAAPAPAAAAAGEDFAAHAAAAAAANADASTEEAAALAAQLMQNPQALLEAIAATMGGEGGAAEEEEYDPENPFT